MENNIPETEQRNPASYQIDTKTTAEILTIINNEDKKVPYAVAQAIPQLIELVDRAAEVFENGGKLFYIGAGSSGRLGILDASECPCTYGIPPDMVQGLIAGGDAALRQAVEGAEDDETSGIEQLRAAGFSAHDMLVGITASGSAPYVQSAIQYARSLGSVTAVISCNKETPIFQFADYAIFLPVGPEIIAGSTRMKAGTAQKLALNMITTTAMIKLGKVYNNVMIDLTPVNSKLIERSKRLIAEITGCSAPYAAQIFEESGRKIRIAVVMASLHTTRDEAEMLLKKGHNDISTALEIYRNNG